MKKKSTLKYLSQVIPNGTKYLPNTLTSFDNVLSLALFISARIII